MGMFLKDPAARLDYAVEWSATNLGTATIVSSSWDVEPAGLTVSAQALSGSRTAATLDGGVPGLVYRVVNRIALSDGRSDDRALVIRIEAR